MLSIAAKTDSLFEVVHVQQVVFPLAIEDAEHDHALVVAHGVGSNQTLLGFITLLQLVKNCVSQLLPIELVEVNLLRNDVNAELREHLGFEAAQVPLIGMGVFRRILIEQIGNDAGDIIVKNEFLLLDSLKQLPAQTIDGFALLVHHIVIFKQVFA